MRALTSLSTIAALAVANAFGAEQPDTELCRAIAAFVSAAQAGTNVQMQLQSGVKVVDGAEVKVHECRHGGFDPALELCKYLVPRGSWSSGRMDAESAFRCLSAEARNRALMQLANGESTVVATATVLGMAQDFKTVQIAYERDGRGLSVMTIGTPR